LLLRGDSATAAAHAAGFADAAHLSRTFRRHFGVTPAAMAGMAMDSAGTFKPERGRG
jgi:AraC-like DNA-binding protein